MFLFYVLSFFKTIQRGTLFKGWYYLRKCSNVTFFLASKIVKNIEFNQIRTSKNSPLFTCPFDSNQPLQPPSNVVFDKLPALENASGADVVQGHKVKTLWEGHKIGKNLTLVLTKQLFLLCSVKTSRRFFQIFVAFSEKLNFKSRGVLLASLSRYICCWSVMFFFYA